jgi:hypothetical protein
MISVPNPPPSPYSLAPSPISCRYFSVPSFFCRKNWTTKGTKATKNSLRPLRSFAAIARVEESEAQQAAHLLGGKLFFLPAFFPPPADGNRGRRRSPYVTRVYGDDEAIARLPQALFEKHCKPPQVRCPQRFSSKTFANSIQSLTTSVNCGIVSGISGRWTVCSG